MRFSASDCGVSGTSARVGAATGGGGKVCLGVGSGLPFGLLLRLQGTDPRPCLLRSAWLDRVALLIGHAMRRGPCADRRPLHAMAAPTFCKGFVVLIQQPEQWRPYGVAGRCGRQVGVRRRLDLTHGRKTGRVGCERGYAGPQRPTRGPRETWEVSGGTQNLSIHQCIHAGCPFGGGAFAPGRMTMPSWHERGRAA